MRVTKGTIIRTIMLALVIVNMILKKLGFDVLNIEEDTVTAFVSSLIEIAIIVVSFWKNNSFSENALKADEYLRELRGE